MLKSILCALALLVIPATAHAAEDFMSRIPPEGSVVLNLSANERMEVGQDLLVSSMRYEVVGKDTKEVQSKINGVMKKAVEEAKKAESVKVSTGSYNVYQNYRPVKDKEEERIKEWRGQQTLELKGLDADSLLDVVTKLQGMGLIMNNLSYTLSPEKQESLNDKMMTNALKKLQERAKVAADALGKKTIQFLEINTDGGMNYPRPVPMMARMEMAADSAVMKEAVAEPGEAELNMTVSARILIKD